jgi:hypothetical protein
MEIFSVKLKVFMPQSNIKNVVVLVVNFCAHGSRLCTRLSTVHTALDYLFRQRFDIVYEIL